MLLPQTSSTTLFFKVFAIGIFILCLVVPHNALALTISPARVEVTTDPGKTVEGTLLVVNEQGDTRTFYASAQNFEAQGETGTPSFTIGDSGLASWIHIDSQVTLAKGEQKKIPFTITVPKDADAGGYFAAIFLSTAPVTAKGQSEVSVGAKIGSLVLLRVSGPVKEGGGVLSFGTKNNVHFYTSLPITLTYRFTNDGGDRVNPTGTIVLRNMVGIKTKTLDANPSKGNILPGSTRRFDVDWGEKQDESNTGFFATVAHQWKSFAFGVYMAKLSLAYGSSSTASNYAFVVVFPWQLTIIILIGITGILFVGSRLIKRYNKWIIRKAQMLQK